MTVRGNAIKARVPRGEYHFLAHALDVGAHGFNMIAARHDPGLLRSATRAPRAAR
jgi:hypothetical protein